MLFNLTVFFELACWALPYLACSEKSPQTRAFPDVSGDGSYEGLLLGDWHGSHRSVDGAAVRVISLGAPSSVSCRGSVVARGVVMIEVFKRDVTRRREPGLELFYHQSGVLKTNFNTNQKDSIAMKLVKEKAISSQQKKKMGTNFSYLLWPYL